MSSRKMPNPANDPTGRGKRRSENIDVDKSVFKHVLDKLQKQVTQDEEKNVKSIRRVVRTIPRDNPNDVFKQHSEQAIKMLAQGSPIEPYQLLPGETDLLQHYGYDLDRSTLFDKPDPSLKFPKIPSDSQEILNQYPAWLRIMLESRYKQIEKKYGSKTPMFLKMLGQRLEYQKARLFHMHGFQKGEKEDLKNYLVDSQFDVEDGYMFIGEDVKEADAVRRQNEEEKLEMDPFRALQDHTLEQEREKEKKSPSLKKLSMYQHLDDIRLAHMWSPIITHKAGDALRAALVAGASETEDEDYYEEGADEKTRKLEMEKGVVRHKDEEFVYRGMHWEAIVAEKSGFQEEAREIMNEEFMRPNVLKEHRKKRRQEQNEQRKAERKAKKEIRKAFEKKAKHPLLKQSGERQKYAAVYRERGVGKRPSRLFVRSPCDGPIVNVERNSHQSRRMEALRAYANWIAASTTFKNFIMIIIIGNAALLALETGEFRNIYHYVFDILDSFFLSVYLAEFFLKFFAYPNKYFMSGFNVFDFIILVASLVKAGAEWTNVGDFTYLRFLTIIRALRILRGVSLSVHIQVLVRALLDTLKNHVLSVVILLILLMYITSIIAFYLFGYVSGLNEMFGRFDMGMLQLLAFVTMEGWTDIQDTFEEVGLKHEGRLFCLILIILGNFLFYNIFIAIIIMQISDATDTFRKTRADERDVTVSMKQDQVFRRQKLDMRQLLARQRLGVSDDFYELGGRFVRKLRHDDLVDKQAILFSPLWIDSLYKAMQRAHHTANIIMNQHRKMADRLIRLKNVYDESKLKIETISRARYNRYYEIKSKLRLLKEQFLIKRNVKPKPCTKVRWKPPLAHSKSFRINKIRSVRPVKK